MAAHGFLSLAVSLPPADKATPTSGLLGTYDGNKLNDITSQNGTTLQPDGSRLSEAAIFKFGQSCEYNLLII